MAFYVTTPIFYVNAAPHLGHAYTTIAADVMARHMRQRGEDVFFLTGTDEHGEPVALAAEAQGLEPARARRPQRRALQGAACRSCTRRTTSSSAPPTPSTRPGVQEVLQRVHDNGHVYKGLYEGWYCPRCADFKSEAEQGPDHTCLIHEIALTREQEENWFFRLSTFQEPLEELLATDFVQPAVAAQRGRRVRRPGPAGRQRSRAGSSPGASPCRGTRATSSTSGSTRCSTTTRRSATRGDGEDLTDRFWGAPTTHLIGKDILKFHTIYWPALLMAAGIELPSRVFIHGFLLGGDGRKMSKSLGNVLDPFEVIEPLRRRRAALLPHARRVVRRRRQRLDGGRRDALLDRAGQRPRQPRQPHDQDGPALPRRRGAAGRRSTTALAADFASLHAERLPRDGRVRASPTRSRSIWQRVRRLNALRRGAGAVAARQGRRARRRPRPRARLARRGPARRRGVPAARTCPSAWARCSTRSASRTATLRGFGEGPRGAGRRDLDPLFPRIERAAA